MKKQQSQKYKQKHHRKQFGWLLCMVALLFVRVACEPLTPDERRAFRGSYLEINHQGVAYGNIVFLLPDHEIRLKMGQNYDFYPEKYTNEDTLQKFGGGKYFFKSADDWSRNRILLMTTDGSLKFFNNTGELIFVYYKISHENDVLPPASALKEEKEVIIENFEERKFLELAKKLSKYIINPFEKPVANLSPVIVKEPIIDLDLGHEGENGNDKTGKQNDCTLQLFIIVCVVLLFISLFFVSFLDTSGNRTATEELHIDEAGIDDLSNHYYPSPTDIVIDVKDMNTVDSTKSISKQSNSITTEISTKFENLFSSESTQTEEKESNMTKSSSIFSIADAAESKTLSVALFSRDSNDSKSEENEQKKTDELTLKKTEETLSKTNTEEI